MKNLLSLLFLISLISINVRAQNFVWAKKFGAAISDEGKSITVDDLGNVFTIGDFYGTVDFDPGIGVTNLISAGSSDVFISKLNSSGNLIWAKSIGGSNADAGYSIKVDDYGNVYTTGIFTGTVDFDPGTSSFGLTSYGGFDAFILKLNSNGSFIWARQLGGINYDLGTSIAIDSSENIYTTGFFSGTADFDPGTSIYNLTSPGLDAIFISKLNNLGNFVWAKKISGTGDEQPSAISVDIFENVYVTGNFNGTVDFNPSGSVFNLSSFGGNDCFICKLNVLGNFVWAKQIGGPDNDYSSSILLDTIGNIYTTGFFHGTADFDPGISIANLTSNGENDIFISKLDNSGIFVWCKKMGGGNSEAGNSIALDDSESVFVIGHFQDTADFDPSGSTYNMSSVGSLDIFILKLTNAGNFVWAKQFGGNDFDSGNSIVVDASENIYSTGRFTGTADFDPGIGVYNLMSLGGYDIFISKFSPLIPTIIDFSPIIVCPNSTSISIMGTNFSTATKVLFGGTPASSFNIISDSLITAVPDTGSNGTITITTYYVTATSQSIVTFIYSIPVNAGTGFSICENADSINLNSINAIPYGGIWSGNGISNNIYYPSLLNGLQIITYTLGFAACITTDTIHIMINPTPLITVNSPSICFGNSTHLIANGAYTYFWNPSFGLNSDSDANVIASPSLTTTYTVLGTSLYGCINSSVSLVTVNPLPNIQIESIIICTGDSGILSATGASDYIWNPNNNLNASIGSTVMANPFATTTYTIIGTDSKGCTNTSTAIVNVVNIPFIEIISTDAQYGKNGTINTTVSNGQPPYYYDWRSDDTNYFDDNPYITGLIIGTYYLTVTDQFGCISTVEVEISNENSKDLFIPTGFSPNSDGINDAWEILGAFQYDDIVVSIFNLQGQLIYFQKKNYIPWNGKYKGELVPVGDYYFVIESLSHKRKQTGTLTVKY